MATEGTGPDEQIVGVGRYDRIDDEWAPDTRAEFALIVEDRVQHHGIGSVLFWALVDVARARGLTTLVAEVLAENRRMLNLLRESGLADDRPPRRRHDPHRARPHVGASRASLAHGQQ